MNGREGNGTTLSPNAEMNTSLIVTTEKLYTQSYMAYLSWEFVISGGNMIGWEVKTYFLVHSLALAS